LSPHEKALRLSLEPLPLLRLLFELLRFDERFWVRVAINSSLAGFAGFNGQGRGGVPVAKPTPGTF
jgi:hypothetical protein